MKKIFAIISVIFLTMGLTSCLSIGSNNGEKHENYKDTDSRN